MERFYKDNKEVPDFNDSNVFIPIDSGEWKKPYILSIESLGNKLQIKLDKDLSQMNVTSVKFSDQNLLPERSPESLPVTERTHLAVDENYLYVWVPQVERWKRIPLSYYDIG